MRYLILSDIHANWEALQAVLQDAQGQYDRILCLGDLVGYGPDPNLVVEWAREQRPLTVRGNHDRACASLCSLADFSPAAKTAAWWTRKNLSAENAVFLNQLAQGPISHEGLSLAHGAPQDEDEYLFQIPEAANAFRFIEEPVTFFGHTHHQGGFQIAGGKTSQIEGSTYARDLALDESKGYLINPGSVGQPRDGIETAAYLLFTPETCSVQFSRTAYNVRMTQAKIRSAGLPGILADRLAFGR